MSVDLDRELARAGDELRESSRVLVLVGRRGAPVVAVGAGLRVVFPGAEPVAADTSLLAALLTLEETGAVHVDWPMPAFAQEPAFSPEVEAVAAALVRAQQP